MTGKVEIKAELLKTLQNKFYTLAYCIWISIDPGLLREDLKIVDFTLLKFSIFLDFIWSLFFSLNKLLFPTKKTDSIKKHKHKFEESTIKFYSSK